MTLQPSDSGAKLRSVRRILSLVLIACAPVALVTPRAEALPWVAPGDALPTQVASVYIVERDEPLLTRPQAKAPRRGSAHIGAHLPLYAATRGSGCRGRWLMVGPLAWVCEDRVRLSSQKAIEPELNPEDLPD